MLILMFDAEWNFVDINAGNGTPGFFFNESGLQYAADYGFAGWLGKRFSLFSFVTRQLRSLVTKCMVTDTA